MNKDCAMARDLMPLVIDDVASGESREFVEKHLGECAECRAVYGEMKKEIPAKTAQEKGSEQAAFSKAAEKLKRKKRLRVLRNILLGVLIGCILLGGGLLGFDRLTQAREHIYYGFYNVYLSELKNGDIVFTMDYCGSYDDLGSVIKPEKEVNDVTGEEEYILYVYAEKYLIPRKNAEPMQNHGIMTITSKELQEYAEIRQGVPSEYRTIWKTGGKIDKASAEMEEYYYWNDIDEQLWRHSHETPDGKAFFASHAMRTCWDVLRAQQSAVQRTVPEWQPWTGYYFTEDAPDRKTISWLLSELKEYGIDIGDPASYGIPAPDEGQSSHE